MHRKRLIYLGAAATLVLASAAPFMPARDRLKSAPALAKQFTAPASKKPALAKQTATAAAPPAKSPAPAARAPSPPRDPKTPWITPGLSLDTPQRDWKRPGIAYVNAKVEAAEADKVQVLWKVDTVWEDESVSNDIQKRAGENGLKDGRLQILIPDSSGVVRVFAWAIVNGKATSEDAAETLIEVSYAPRAGRGTGSGASGDATPAGAGKAAAPSPAGSPLTDKGKVVDAYFIIDPKGDATVNDLVASVGLRNRLRSAGVRPHVFEAGSEGVKRNALEPYITDAGGVPAMILVTSDRKVRKAVSCPKTVEEILKEVK